MGREISLSIQSSINKQKTIKQYRVGGDRLSFKVK